MGIFCDVARSRLSAVSSILAVLSGPKPTSMIGYIRQSRTQMSDCETPDMATRVIDDGQIRRQAESFNLEDIDRVLCTSN
jgi:hypothetical protein